MGTVNYMYNRDIYHRNYIAVPNSIKPSTCSFLLKGTMFLPMNGPPQPVGPITAAMVVTTLVVMPMVLLFGSCWIHDLPRSLLEAHGAGWVNAPLCKILLLSTG